MAEAPFPGFSERDLANVHEMILSSFITQYSHFVSQRSWCFSDWRRKKKMARRKQQGGGGGEEKERKRETPAVRR